MILSGSSNSVTFEAQNQFPKSLQSFGKITSVNMLSVKHGFIPFPPLINPQSAPLSAATSLKCCQLGSNKILPFPNSA